jgi:hypothetical protein
VTFLTSVGGNDRRLGTLFGSHGGSWGTDGSTSGNRAGERTSHGGRGRSLVLAACGFGSRRASPAGTRRSEEGFVAGDRSAGCGGAGVDGRHMGASGRDVRTAGSEASVSRKDAEGRRCVVTGVWKDGVWRAGLDRRDRKDAASFAHDRLTLFTT